MIRNCYLVLFLLLFTCSGAIAQINFNSSASFKYLKGKDASGLPANWMTGDYSPAGWLNGTMPFRYGDGTGGTELTDMQNNYSTVYLRSTFTASQIQNLNDVNFSVNFDDGFIIWINGVELFRVNAPDVPAWNSFSTDLHEFGDFTPYPFPAHDILLNEGENTIAVQVFNTSLESSDIYFDLRITADVPIPQTSDSLKAVFSKPNGFYDEPFDLTLNVPDDSYNLIYTIDGSNPQNSATRISGGKSATITVDPDDWNGRASTPCFIVRASLQKDGFNPSFPFTQTYIFLDRVISQSDPGGDWPSAGNVNGQVIDLKMDPDVTNDPKFSGLMRQSLTDIPSISVVTDNKDLFDPAIGIYVNAENHGEQWERFSSVELIDPSGKPGFNINAGLRIRGGWSRHDDYPKHAFRLFFRAEYGAPKLKFPLFEAEGVDEFDKVDLRCEQNYAWSHPSGSGGHNTAVREVFSRDTQRDMGQPYTRSRYYHLYLNGMYWGLYQTQERSEARFAADYLGGSKEDYDVVKVNGDFSYDIEATDGNLDSWNKIYNLTKTGFSTNAAYFALEGKDENGKPKKGGEVIVDIDNLIDYMLIIFYTGNYDAPVSAFSGNMNPNNFYAIDRRDDRSSGFKFFAHDAEHALMVGTAEGPGIGLNENRVTIGNMWVGSANKFHPQWLHSKLVANKEYRLRFADRVYKHFFNKGVFVPQMVHDRFQVRVDQLKKSMIAESARWGDFTKEPPFTIDDWTAEINDIYKRYFPFRTDIVLSQLKTAGLYLLFNPPVFTKDNVQLTKDAYTVTGNYQVTLTASTGQLYYTLDATDPRLIGDQINPTAKEIITGGTINLQGTSQIKARVKSGDRWSALAEVKFVDSNEDYSNLKITELHYHPTDSLVDTLTVSGKSFEFVELKNTGDKPINLTGLNFSSSIDYQFGKNEVLPPKQFYVIASKPKWFWERHFMIPSGNFGKNFSNTGEQVTISDSIGNPVIDFLYSGLSPWETAPDGQGPSLSAALKMPNGNPADFNYWMTSSVYDGTPFADDPGIIDSIDDPGISDTEVVLFPNPTRGLIHVKVRELKTDVSVEIYSLTGTMIYQTNIGENKDIDFRSMNVSSGIYLVNVRCNEKVSVHKVIYQPKLN